MCILRSAKNALLMFSFLATYLQLSDDQFLPHLNSRPLGQKTASRDHNFTLGNLALFFHNISANC